MKEFIKNSLKEAFSKTEKEEIDKQVATFIDKKEMEKKIEKIVLRKIKDNKELEDKVTEITKDVLASLFKTLWVKKGTWLNGIK